LPNIANYERIILIWLLCVLFLDQLLNFTTSLHCPACFTRHSNLQVQALHYSTQVSFTSTWYALHVNHYDYNDSSTRVKICIAHVNKSGFNKEDYCRLPSPTAAHDECYHKSTRGKKRKNCR